MKGSPFYRNFGIGSPNKQTTVYEGRDNEKGQSQKDVLEKRNKDITDYDDAVSEYKNEEGKLDITEAQYEAYKKKRQALIDAQTTSTDSINTENKKMNLKIEADNKKIKADNKKKKEDAEKKKKKADDSGLFMKSPSKQFEEGDYYDTRSKSPNKQRDLGGTKSGKGNIFTKRGRTQRKLNKYQDEQNKLRSEHIDKNKKATKLAVKAHEEKMIKKQLKNRPKTVVMKGDKDVTKRYR